jgi:hypothetical protein
MRINNLRVGVLIPVMLVVRSAGGHHCIHFVFNRAWAIALVCLGRDSKPHGPILSPSQSTTTMNPWPRPQSLSLTEVFSKPHVQSLDRCENDTVMRL